MPDPPSFDQVCNEFRHFRHMIGKVMANTNESGIRQQLEEVTRGMDENFSELLVAYSQAEAEFDRYRVGDETEYPIGQAECGPSQRQRSPRPRRPRRRRPRLQKSPKLPSPPRPSISSSDRNFAPSCWTTVPIPRSTRARLPRKSLKPGKTGTAAALGEETDRGRSDTVGEGTRSPSKDNGLPPPTGCAAPRRWRWSIAPSASTPPNDASGNELPARGPTEDAPRAPISSPVNALHHGLSALVVQASDPWQTLVQSAAGCSRDPQSPLGGRFATGPLHGPGGDRGPARGSSRPAIRSEPAPGTRSTARPLAAHQWPLRDRRQYPRGNRTVGGRKRRMWTLRGPRCPSRLSARAARARSRSSPSPLWAVLKRTAKQEPGGIYFCPYCDRSLSEMPSHSHATTCP